MTGNQPGAFSVNTDGDGNSGNGIQATTTVLDSLSLGNLVFWDKNGDGLFDGADVGVNGVTLSLFVDADNDNAPDSPASPIATTTTAGGGLYSFTGIAPGHYIVRVDAANFTGPAGALKFLQTSPTTTPEPIDPDPTNPRPTSTTTTTARARSASRRSPTPSRSPTTTSRPASSAATTPTTRSTSASPTSRRCSTPAQTPTLTAINEDAPRARRRLRHACVAARRPDAAGRRHR